MSEASFFLHPAGHTPTGPKAHGRLLLRTVSPILSLWNHECVTPLWKGGQSACWGYVRRHYSWPTSSRKASINELMSSYVFVLILPRFKIRLCHSFKWRPFVQLPFHSPVWLCSRLMTPAFVSRWLIRSATCRRHLSERIWCVNTMYTTGAPWSFQSNAFVLRWCSYITQYCFTCVRFFASSGNKRGQRWNCGTPPAGDHHMTNNHQYKHKAIMLRFQSSINLCFWPLLMILWYLFICVYLSGLQFRTAHNSMAINLLRVYFHLEQRITSFFCDLIGGYIPDSSQQNFCQHSQQQFICLSFDTTSRSRQVWHAVLWGSREVEGMRVTAAWRMQKQNGFGCSLCSELGLWGEPVSEGTIAVLHVGLPSVF